MYPEDYCPPLVAVIEMKNAVSSHHNCSLGYKGRNNFSNLHKKNKKNATNEKNQECEDGGFSQGFCPFYVLFILEGGLFHGGEGDWGVIFHFPKIGKNSILARKWPPAREKAFVFGHAPKGQNERFGSSTIGRSVHYVKKNVFCLLTLTF